jgi:5-methylcytosine-specific restriction endonuclease McrA
MHNQLTRESFQRVREMVKARDDETCQYCGKHDPGGEVDHILPLSRGGIDALCNLVWACQECNTQKGDKTPREWLKRITGAGSKFDDLLPEVGKMILIDASDENKVIDL